MSIRALLFDLDGTLLPIDTDQFIEAYMKRLSVYMLDLFEPERFLKQLWASTYVMIKNSDPTLTNQQVFEQDFYPKIGVEYHVVEPILNRFYEEEFPKLVEYVKSHGFIPELIQKAKEFGYQLVVATNPLFPKSAIDQRIRWAGIDPSDFVWITSYEVSHFCKPNPKYFQEIAEKIGVAPEECLMIGNDVQEDMIAKTIGMKTYLITDYKIDRGEPRYIPDQQGTMREFYDELRDRKGIFL